LPRFALVVRHIIANARVGKANVLLTGRLCERDWVYRNALLVQSREHRRHACVALQRHATGWRPQWQKHIQSCDAR
jgi:hypothetical protein